MSLRPYIEAKGPRRAATAVALGTIVLAGSLVVGRLSQLVVGSVLAITLIAAFVYYFRAELSQRSVALLLVAILAYAFAWNRGEPFLFAFSAVSFALLVVAHVLPRRMLRPVLASVHAPTQIVQGEAVSVSVVIRNPTRSALRLIEIEMKVSGAVLPEEPARALIVYLAPGASETLTITTKPLRRGLQVIGPLIAMTGYPLGLVTPSLVISGSERKLWVYPRMFPVEWFSIAGASLRLVGDAISPRGAGAEEFAGVREYRRGDGRRHIHWRASARRGQLVVKEFLRTTATMLTIALDMGARGSVGEGIETATEYVVSIGAALARYALEEGHHVQVLLCGTTLDRCGPVVGSAELDRLLRALALATASGEQPLRRHMAKIDAYAPPESTVALVALDVDAYTDVAWDALRLRGRSVVPIVVDVGSFPESDASIAPSRPSRSGIRRISRGMDLAASFRR